VNALKLTTATMAIAALMSGVAGAQQDRTATVLKGTPCEVFARAKTDAALATCAKDVAKHITEQARTVLAPPSASSKAVADQQAKDLEEQLHDYLVSAYFTYRKLRQAYVGVKDPTVDLTTAMMTLQRTLEEQLDAHGILPRFSAISLTGFSFTSLGAQTAARKITTTSGSPATSTVSDADVSKWASLDSQNSTATGFVVWETRHAGFVDQRGGRPDFSVGGSIAFRPVLVPISFDDPTDTDKKTRFSPVVTFQEAFVWDTGFDLHWRIGDANEHGPFVRYGQTILTSTDVLVTGKMPTTIGTPLNNMTGRAEGVGQVGYRLNLFASSLDRMHTDKGILQPTFSASAGWRYDARFKGQGELASFSSPEQRFFYAVSVDALDVAGLNVKDSPVKLTVRVEYERALHQSSSGYIPSATRVFVQGSTDILKAIKGK